MHMLQKSDCGTRKPNVVDLDRVNYVDSFIFQYTKSVQSRQSWPLLQQTTHKVY